MLGKADGERSSGIFTLQFCNMFCQIKLQNSNFKFKVTLFESLAALHANRINALIKIRICIFICKGILMKKFIICVQRFRFNW